MCPHLHFPSSEVSEQCPTLPEITGEIHIEPVLLHIPLRHLRTEPATAKTFLFDRQQVGDVADITVPKDVVLCEKNTQCFASIHLLFTPHFGTLITAKEMPLLGCTATTKHVSTLHFYFPPMNCVHSDLLCCANGTLAQTSDCRTTLGTCSLGATRSFVKFDLCKWREVIMYLSRKQAELPSTLM